MVSVLPSNAAAVLILQQAAATSVGQDDASKTITDLANGVAKRDSVSVDKQPTQAASKVASAMFGVNHTSVTETKLKLIERMGQALGLNKDDFSTSEEFFDAAKQASQQIQNKPDGNKVIASIEKDLGLDKLGISLSDLINDARNPKDNDKLTEALKKQANGKDEEREKAAALLAGRIDEDGIYRGVTASGR